MIGFAISSFLAGVGGSLIAYSSGQLSDQTFTTFTGLSLLAIAYFGSTTSISGAMIAGVLGPPALAYASVNQSLNAGNYYAVIFGLALIVRNQVLDRPVRRHARQR